MRGLDKKYLLIILLFLSNNLCAQTKEELKNQKIQIEKEIDYTKTLLNKTSLNKKKSLNYLKVVKSQIKSQEQLSITLNIEIKLLQRQIKKTKTAIKKMNN